jgi:hypothetical protein
MTVNVTFSSTIGYVPRPSSGFLAGCVGVSGSLVGSALLVGSAAGVVGAAGGAVGAGVFVALLQADSANENTKIKEATTAMDLLLFFVTFVILLPPLLIYNGCEVAKILVTT